MNRTQRKKMLSDHMDDRVRETAYKAWYIHAGIAKGNTKGSYFTKVIKKC